MVQLEKSMPTTKQCRTCGTDVPNNAPFGHCPKCLLDLGFGPMPEVLENQVNAEGAQRFGDYELIEQLGRGGMGIVYKARQVRLNRLVALKMISAGEFASPMLIQRFHREAEAAANLHHPNVIPIYETGEHQGQHFFSMQLVDGVGLDRHIGRTGFSRGLAETDARSATRTRQETIARILGKVARAVDYAHQHGVLHRDIKPSNIILDSRGEPLLTDFGVAKVLGHDASNLTASGAIMGTPSYMAPEQAAGDSKRITVAADVYSLGAILYAMLTGSPPFRAETPVETLRQVVEQEPKHPSTLREGIDSDLATIAMKCLEKEPRRRYASASALAEDLERWIRRESILAQPIGPAGRAFRWCRREPVLAALAGGIVVCLVAITVGALVAYHREQVKRQDLDLAYGRLRLATEQSISVTEQAIKDQLDDLDTFWTNSNDVAVKIPAERLANLTARLPKREGVRIPFGAYTHTKPSDMFTRFAPVLSYLETNVTAVSIRFDFYIYRGYSNAVEALSTGKVGFMRPGPGSYISARQRNRGLRLLVKQLHDRQPVIHGSIFTRSDSDILSLHDIMGKSVASADEESTFGNFVPKAILFDRGIRRRDLALWNYVGAHDETVIQVRDRIYQVGTANSNVVARYVEQDIPLRILHSMQSISFPWVVSEGVEETVIQAIRVSLLSLKDPTILRKIDPNLDGFTGASPEDYDAFEKDVMKKARAFDE